jgi:hypothetical protein
LYYKAKNSVANGETSDAQSVLATLPKLKNLVSLSLGVDIRNPGLGGDEKAGAAAVAAIVQLPNLKYLSILDSWLFLKEQAYGFLRPTDLSPLAQMPLATLNLSACELLDEQVLQISGSNSIRGLALSGRDMNFTSAIVAAIAQMPALEDLEIRDASFHGVDLSPLAQMPSLTALNLSGWRSKRLSHKQVLQLSQSSSIRRLTLSGPFTETSIGYLGLMKNLTRLDLWKVGLDNSIAQSILKANPKLEYFSW